MRAGTLATQELGETFLEVKTSAHNSQTGLRTCHLAAGLSLWRDLAYTDIAFTLPSTRVGGAGWDMQLVPPFAESEK